jgi:hypothetical protein
MLLATRNRQSWLLSLPIPFWSLTAQAGLACTRGVESKNTGLTVVDRYVEVFRQPGALDSAPAGYGYHSIQRFAEGENLAPLAAPDYLLTVADMLP